jgi:hypothetical protein
MAPYLPLTLLLVLTRSWLLDAWIQARSNERHNTFKLGSHSEDLNFQRLQLESVFNEDVVDYQQDDTLHVGGLYESLSVLPVYDWPDYEFDFTSCRDDECDEVSRQKIFSLQ